MVLFALIFIGGVLDYFTQVPDVLVAFIDPLTAASAGLSIFSGIKGLVGAKENRRKQRINDDLRAAVIRNSPWTGMNDPGYQDTGNKSALGGALGGAFQGYLAGEGLKQTVGKTKKLWNDLKDSKSVTSAVKSGMGSVSFEGAEDDEADDSVDRAVASVKSHGSSGSWSDTPMSTPQKAYRTSEGFRDASAVQPKNVSLDDLLSGGQDVMNFDPVNVVRNKLWGGTKGRGKASSRIIAGSSFIPPPTPQQLAAYQNRNNPSLGVR